MTDANGPRLVTPEEFSEMMGLLDRYFAYERGGMQASLPFAYDPDHSDHHAIIVEDDRIVSHIGAVPQILSTGVDGETVECWGIGGVATDRRYRGNGYMSELLEFWFDRMADEELPLSDLSGNRQRYAHFGYENVGTEYQYKLTERSFDGDATASEAVVGYEADAHLETLHEIHEAEPYRVVRDLDETRTVLGQRDLETFVYGGNGNGDGGNDNTNGPAYVSLTRTSRSRTIEEFGGSERGLETLLSHVLALLDLNELTARVPPRHPLEPIVSRHSRFWTARPHRKFRINDLQAVLEAFEGQLEERWLESGRSDEGSVELAFAGEQSVRIGYGPDGVSVEPGSDGLEPDVECERTTMSSLLFGMHDRCAHLRVGDPLLETALPLRFFVWASEHV
ncbi:GNAT family N-acetyltransferase [Natronosalvus rutilus]|uniref:GNAT family N-acetyltransferase n=1 Tax=Natronosalvus rutilus TaxID=2953753 RepID=A0A9E7STE8_9EURY|nr:GNAT family N-acetyltransferase [Natronosalvus rutilus]UTF52465.1 GNAT family N-acetyltransferase [Natronosalvus rutilus]